MKENRYEWLPESEDFRTPFPDQCIHRLFEEQVAQSPMAVAVSDGELHMTYEQLNSKANKLARYLRKHGVDCNSLVGACLDQSPEMIVTFLGILKAGAAYVPLDPSYPEDRLRFMVEDTQIPVLVTNKHHHARFLDLPPVIIRLELECEYIDREPDNNLSIQTTPEDLAYVIYTSGSTGKPKGVMVPQKAVNRLVLNTNYVCIQPHHRMAQVSNCSFDAATFEVWGALLNGAQLVILPKDTVLSSEQFAQELKEKQIDIMFLTSSLFNQLACDVPGMFSTLEYLIVGGEALDCHWVRTVLEQGAPRHLLNGYGPTENTTFSTTYRVTEVPENMTSIPIGQAISNTWCAVLDEQLQPVSSGVPGELYVGGEGLAQGYLNRDDLTSERFILVSTKKGKERLYKTGDRVRRLPDGNIEYLGRMDDQVKIRGFRIEPSEIAATIKHFPHVLDCVVLAHEEEGAEKALVAYLIVESEEEPSIEEIRRYLERKLPEFMIPSFFVFIDRFPINANGKLDRGAFPKPEYRHHGLNVLVKKAQGIVEQELVAIWSELLKVNEISVDWDFLKMGGHSLLATQVLNRIRERFGIGIPLSLFFQHSTVEKLAQIIEQRIREEIEGMSEEQAEQMMRERL